MGKFDVDSSFVCNAMTDRILVECQMISSAFLICSLFEGELEKALGEVECHKGRAVGSSWEEGSIHSLE